jgi:hypothetical protein
MNADMDPNRSLAEILIASKRYRMPNFLICSSPFRKRQKRDTCGNLALKDHPQARRIITGALVGGARAISLVLRWVTAWLQIQARLVRWVVIQSRKQPLSSRFMPRTSPHSRLT